MQAHQSVNEALTEATEESPKAKKVSSKKSSKSKQASPEPDANKAAEKESDDGPFDVTIQDANEDESVRGKKSARAGSRKSVRLSVAGSPELAAETLAAAEYEGPGVCSSSFRRVAVLQL